MVSFDIEQAKKQVDAVPKLALPYFLDACDEVERLRQNFENLAQNYDDEVTRLNAELKNRMGGVTTP